MLFGRKINLAEDPLALVALMKRLVEGEIEPAEAVRAYYAALAEGGPAPARGRSGDSEHVLR